MASQTELICLLLSCGFSLLYIETADRPGLLLEMIKIMADINVNVESAEIETEVCPLGPPLSPFLIWCLSEHLLLYFGVN